MFSGFELYSRLVPLLRLVSQPASHRNVSIEVTRLQQLAARTDFDNLLQLRSVVRCRLFRFFQKYVSLVISMFSSVLVTFLDVSKSLSL